MKRLLPFSIMLMFACVLILTTPQQSKAHFILASWDYPDEYGQGIDEISIYENTGSGWQSLTPFGWLNEANYDAFEISEGANITIKTKCWFNNTIVNASSLADGKNYIRHNADLYHVSGGLILSVENFSYYTSSDALDPMFYYTYNCTLNFSPIGGFSYLAVLHCEIFW